MANYLAHHTKKKEILEKREFQLMKAIEKGFPNEKIQKLASEVRDAQSRVINAKESQMVPSDSDRDLVLIQRIEKDRKYWKTISIDEIIEIYRRKCT